MESCEYCGKHFKGIRGVRVHQQKAHPDSYNQKIIEEQRNRVSRARWTNGEITALARKEKEILRNFHGETKLNKLLFDSNVCPGRTLESIKWQRHRADYRALVESFASDIVSDQTEEGPRSSPRVPSGRSADAVVATDGLMGEGFGGPSEDGEAEVDFTLCIDHRPSYISLDLLSELYEAIRNKNMDIVSSLINRVCVLVSASLGSQKERRKKKRDRQAVPPKNQRQRRRQLYAVTQKRWIKDKGSLVRDILDGKELLECDKIHEVSDDDKFSYWSYIFGKESKPFKDNTISQSEICWESIAPVTPAEVDKILKKSRNSAPGTDGVTVRKVKANLTSEFLSWLFSLILWSGQSPSCFGQGRTVLIPKKDRPTGPGDYRPITILSVLIRTFHKILADRLGRLLPYDKAQKAFTNNVDGCLENIVLLQETLKISRTKAGNLCMASIDIAKAFDSASHHAILAAATARGIPPLLAKYMKSTFQGFTTEVCGKVCRVRRGVRQGDPISPWLFNTLLDYVWKYIDHAGYKLRNDECEVKVMSYADDMIVFGDSIADLQTALNQLQGKLSECGLEINTTKSYTLASRTEGRRRVVDQGARFRMAGQLGAMKPSDCFQYLGVVIDASGKIRLPNSEDLRLLLHRLTMASLKPMQRLTALNDFVWPRLLHRCVFSEATTGGLKQMDLIVRKYIRQWLKLPQDVSIGFIHGPQQAGGLGVRSFRVSIPLLRLKRFEKCLTSADPRLRILARDGHHRCMMTRCERMLCRSSGGLPVTPEEYWISKLKSCLDYRHMIVFRCCPRITRGAFQWLMSHAKGWEFVGAVKMRSGCAPTKVRNSRGRREQRTRQQLICEGLCGEPESVGHVLQRCTKTYRVRIKRHDIIVELVAKLFREKGFSVLVEPRVPTDMSFCKPDIIAYTQGSAFVFDVQVVASGTTEEIDRCFKNKKEKYDNQYVQNYIDSLRGEVRQRMSVVPITATWNGALCPRTVSLLMKAGVRQSFLSFVSAKIAIESWKMFLMYKTGTSKATV